jgi:hypothetical protein
MLPNAGRLPHISLKLNMDLLCVVLCWFLHCNCTGMHSIFTDVCCTYNSASYAVEGVNAVHMNALDKM